MSKPNAANVAPPPRRSWAGRRLGRAVIWEVVLIAAVLAVLTMETAGFIVAGVLLVGAIVLGVPFGGLTVLERIRRRRRFAGRASQRAENPALPTDLVPLGEWVPGLSVSQTRSASGDDVGVIADGGSWTALLGVTSDDNLVAARDDQIDLAALSGLTVQDDIVFAALQVITYTVPAPAGVMLTPGAPAIASYQQILGEGTVPPAVRRTWIGVRLDPRLCLEAIASRGASNDGIYATLRFGLHRVQSALKRQGITTRELTALEINDVLALTAGSAPDFGAERSRENWDHWSCDGFAHVGRGIASWGAEHSVGYQRLLDALSSAPIVFGVTSYTLDKDDRAAGGLRVVAPTSAAAAQTMTDLQQALGDQLSFAPAGGDQVPAMLGTVPLGREVSV